MPRPTPYESGYTFRDGPMRLVHSLQAQPLPWGRLSGSGPGGHPVHRSNTVKRFAASTTA